MCDVDLHISFFPCGCPRMGPGFLRKVRVFLFVNFVSELDDRFIVEIKVKYIYIFNST